MNAYAGVAPTGTEELLARAQTGEREAFTELVDRHQRPVSTERLAEALQPMMEKTWQFLQVAFEWCSARGNEARDSIARWKVLVPPRVKVKRTRATGFRRGK